MQVIAGPVVKGVSTVPRVYPGQRETLGFRDNSLAGDGEQSVNWEKTLSILHSSIKLS